MSIVNGLNLELPDGRRGHYVRVRTYKDGKVKQKFFDVVKLGEKEATKQAKAWLKAEKQLA